MKALVLGAVHRSGVSEKGKGKPYDFSVVQVLRPAENSKNAHMDVRGVGLVTADIQARPQVVEQLAKLGPFPLNCELTIENEVNRFGQLAAVCTGAAAAEARPAARIAG